MKGDWLKLHRKMVEWEWYDDANTFRVFMHLLLSANWKSNKWRRIDIKKGDLLIPTDLLGNRLSLSKQQVRTALNKLESTGEITRKSTRYGLLITLCKWEDYQSSEETDQQVERHLNQQGANRELTPKSTGSQQGVNRELTPLEEGKKGKKERTKENTPIVPQGTKKRDRRPTMQELIAAIPGSLSPEKFELAKQFAEARQSYIPASKRFGTINAFVKQCERMSAYPLSVVEKAVEEAIRREWQAWEQDGVKSQLKTTHHQTGFANDEF